MRISVIIPHYNREAYLRAALIALDAQDRPADEIIVCDDGSPVPPATICEQFGVTLVTHERKGHGTAYARWHGTQESTGDLLVYIDCDVLLCPGALRVYEEAAQKNPNRVLCGYIRAVPLLRLTTDIIRYRWEDIFAGDIPPATHQPAPQYILGKDPREAVGQMVFFDDPYRVWEAPLSMLSGNVAMTRDVYNRAGGWNKDYFARGQDAEFSIRIARAGIGFSYLFHAAGCHMAHKTFIPEGAGSDALKELYPEYFATGSFVWKKE